MRTYLAVTDRSWFEFLAARPQITEANFWMPSGGPGRFAAIAPNETFLFKTHHPDNRIVGGGTLSDYRRLPLSLAWETVGERNGVGSLESMRAAIGGYRKASIGSAEDPIIGCAMLRDLVFFEDSDLRPTAAEFAGNLVRGKSFEVGAQPGSVIEEAYWRLAAGMSQATWQADVSFVQEQPMFGPPGLRIPRLGQTAFAAVVSDAYQLRCAITGAKIRPALQAAHIRPVASAGQHRVDNGLLLRADVHIMFDRGYLAVEPNSHRLRVSRQLREVFGNGEEFYSRAGQPIQLPVRRIDHPASEFLQWHLDEIFDR